MRTQVLLPTMLTLLLTLSLGLVTQATADPLSSQHHPLLSDRVVLNVTRWAPQELTDSAKACDLAKALALVQLGTTFSDLHLTDRTRTTRFPAHFVCQWDPAHAAYQAVLSVELPELFMLGTLTADRLY